MSQTVRSCSGPFIVVLLAILGGCAGLVGSTWLPRPTGAEKPGERLPLPHHIAKYPDGVTLRFAMVHDVIHERFPRHGSAYYEERNRRVGAALRDEKARQAKGAAPSAQYWDLVDDLGVGIDRLGRHEEAVALLRDKLQQQMDQALRGRDLYGTYANLGTFLILWQIQEGFADKEKAKQRVTESIGWIRHAVEVKPDAHFGREMWQATLEEFILAVLDTPELLLQYDMVGDRLDRPIDPKNLRAFDAGTWIHGHAHQARWLLRGDTSPNETEAERSRQTDDLRKSIVRVGAEEGWSEKVATEHKKPVPFDEPALGIIGMWRYGGGANPHFALALGEIMLRVGQRYVAWTAYERIASPVGGLNPDALPPQLIAHCRKRQQVIEAQLPPDEVARFRPRFEKELAAGQAYQKAYQDFEARQIRAGVSIDDPHFYDAFLAEHGAIASPVGEEDQFVIQSRGFSAPRFSLVAALLAAGVAAFLGAVLLRFISGRQRSKVKPRDDSDPAAEA